MKSINSLKKVLLTEATSFLGSNLAKVLLLEKYELIILKRSFSNISRIENIFGVLPYRKNETMISQVNFDMFKQLEWQLNVTLQQGIKKTNAEMEVIK
jgi:nucleoside-diphosphate-sugar epimerase